MRYQDTAKRNNHYRCLEYDHDQPGDLCLVACGMEKCDPGEDSGVHIRDCYHLHVVRSGTGVLYAGGKTIHPHAGQFFLLKHNGRYQYIADAKDPWDYCWVTYCGADAKRLSEEIGFVDGIYCLDSDVPAERFYELVSRMHQYPEMNRTSDLRRRGILLEFVALALDATESVCPNRGRAHAYSEDVYVSRAVDFIHYNYATINVSDVVNFIGFNRSYFATVFHRKVGASPQEYIRQYRLNKSCLLLSGTGLPIQEVAARVGYENQMSFARMFKKAYGVTPTEFRAKNRTDDPVLGAGHK
ncbi:MAG: AraC family transcriptional regulator [Eubacterium sp.]|nr:AraC family transcriptional regulator [Eubacterium sp.]